jgi:PTS system nitrogen regulatory IIA component
MKIIELLDLSSICSDLKAKNKNEVIEELVDILFANKKIKNKEDAINVLIEREKIGSTGIGYGIAIPHAKTEQIDGLVAGFGRSKMGINFDSLDGEPVNLIFLLLAPIKESAGLHLKALARISSLLKDKSFREQLINANGEKEIYKYIIDKDSKI